MILSSLAMLALSASAAISPLNMVHLHPHVAQTDTRVRVEILNSGLTFRDVTVGEKTYTVEPQHALTIKAPAGTMVYAASRSSFHKRGDALLTLDPQMNKQVLKLD